MSKVLIREIKENRRDLAIITAVFLLASVILYGYFNYFTDGNMDTLYRNWDGPGYRIAAETLYNVGKINEINPYPFLPPTHYAYQFPLYPVFIRIFSFMGFKESMIFVSVLFSLLFIYAVYFLVKKMNPQANALVVALLIIFYTPRWFIVSHVGSSEPLLLFCLTLMLLLFMQKRYILSAVFAAFAQMTKSQGIIFFAGITVYMLHQIFITRIKIAKVLHWYIPFLFVPLALVLVFTLYYLQYGNFFIYFTIKQFNVIQLPPLKVFFVPAGYFELWKEAPLFDYILYLIPIFILFSKKLYFSALVALVYFIPCLCLVHQDVSRYIMPLLPFAALAYSDAFSKKSVYIPMFLCVPIIYLYAISFINFNIAP